MLVSLFLNLPQLLVRSRGGLLRLSELADRVLGLVLPHARIGLVFLELLRELSGARLSLRALFLERIVAACWYHAQDPRRSLHNAFSCRTPGDTTRRSSTIGPTASQSK